MSEGQIITFYSYKGGTGRSMLLANVAWILAANGRRVLAVDWDLEAPGLHRYFHPFLLDQGLTETEGVIDFVMDFTTAAIDPDKVSGEDPDWFDPYADMAQYAVPLERTLLDSGRLDFMGPGRQGASYSTRVNSFDWQRFYERFGGGPFLARARRHLKTRYDYVLVDSRTGLSDTSGICTVQMPDALVVCFTLNNQSVEGAAEVTRSVREQRGDALPILTVPMRIDNSEKAKLDLRRQAALEKFAGVVAAPGRLERQWADVEMVYQAFYAYEEVLATFGDIPGRRNTILASAERVTAWLTDNEITESVRINERRRREVLAAYEGTVPLPELPDAVGEGVYLSYRREDAAGQAGRLYDALERELGQRRVLMDVDLAPGADFVELVAQSVRSAAVVLALIGPSWLEARDRDGRRRLDDQHDFVRHELEVALASKRPVVPVLVGGATVPRADDLPPALRGLARRQAIELTDARWSYDVNRLIAAVELAVAGAARRPDDAAPTGPVYQTSPSSEALIDQVLKTRRVNWLAIAVAVVSLAVAVVTILATR
jgi:cellulose biosynthesis protein BcsQ